MAIICAQCGHRNADGSRFCANRECGAFLAWSGEQGATPGAPPPEPSALPPEQGDATRWGYDAGGQSDAAASMALTETELSVQPGETVTTTVSVHNGGSQVEQFAVLVLGPTAGWAEIDPPVVVVYPDSRGEAVIRWSPPRQSATVAGQAAFTVRATSVLHRGLQVHAGGVLEVGEFRELTGTLTPQTTAGRWQTTHRIELTNAGNVVESVQLKATDPAGRIRFSLPGGELPVPPGSQSIEMSVRPPWRFLGRPVSQPFQVLATPRPPLTPVRLDGTREIVPLIAGWIPKVVTGLVALAVAAAVLWVTQRPDEDDQTPADAATVGASQAATISPPSKPAEGGRSPGGGPPPPPGASGPPASSVTPAPSAPRLWAVVDASGAQVSAAGVASVISQSPGRTQVTFTRDVADCVYAATVAASGGQPVPERGLAFVASGDTAASVVVETRDLDETLQQPYPFHLQVRCDVGDTAVVVGDRAVRGTNDPEVRRLDGGSREVRFLRGVRDCAYVATIGDPGGGRAGTGLVSVGSGQRASAVVVDVKDVVGTRLDLPFHLMSRCSGLFAVVGTDGRADRKDSVEEVSRGEPGTWDVRFNQDVSRCSYVAAVGSVDDSPVDVGGVVFAASGPQPDTVTVQTRKLDAIGAGVLTDFPFHLQVVC